MTDNKKAVFELLKAESPVKLPDLKEKAGLSNKKWDKAIKGLTKKNVVRMENTDAGLLVTLQ